MTAHPARARHGAAKAPAIAKRPAVVKSSASAEPGDPPPSDAGLRATLGASHAAWTRLLEAIAERIGPLDPLWARSSAKAGWSLRVRRGGRVIVYLSPRDGHFLVSFALGEKAVAAARARKLPAAVLETIEAAPRYAEGRGVRFEVRGTRDVAALASLAEAKHES